MGLGSRANGDGVGAGLRQDQPGRPGFRGNGEVIAGDSGFGEALAGRGKGDGKVGELLEVGSPRQA